MVSGAVELKWNRGWSTPASVLSHGWSGLDEKPESISIETESVLGDAATEYTEDVAVERQASVEEAAITFKKLLCSVEGVEAILATRDGDGVVLSAIVNNVPWQHRQEIHDREWELMQRFLGTGFDFRVIDLRDRPLCNVISVESADVYLRV